jgi:signal transduction histidine kinase
VSGASAPVLEQAFQRFERAAQRLEQRHGTLSATVERLERQLLNANRRLEAVLDAVDGGVAVVASDRVLLRANRAFERLGLGSAGDRPRHPALRELLESGAGRGAALRFHQPTDTGPRELSATIVPTGDAEQTQVLTVQDITELRREEEEGGRRRRLEALGRMAAELAHEVRNPLGSIRLFAAMLREDLEDRAEPRAMAEQILAATSGLEATVSNLLSFASPTCGKRERLDLCAVAGEACALLAPSCAVRGVALEGPDARATCSLLGDAESLRQVVLNLLGNALAATGAGGRIDVAVRCHGGRAVLEVQDDGRGIAPEDLSRVFDPFFTRTEGGTGLGLSIVHRTVERHGGRITLASEPGRGTRVHVELPVSDGEPA